MSPRRSQRKKASSAEGPPTSSQAPLAPPVEGNPSLPQDRPGPSDTLEEAVLASGATPQIPSPATPAENPSDAITQAAEWLLQLARKKLINQADEVAVAARARLRAEGLNWGNIQQLPLGVLGSLEECRLAFRQSDGAEESTLLYWLKDARLANSVVGPIRDAGGGLLTLWARPIEALTPGTLYRHAWQQRLGFYGVDVLARQRPAHVLAVERLLDALILQSHGIEPVIALGKRWDDVPGERWTELLRWGVVQVTLLPACASVPGEIWDVLRRRLLGIRQAPELWVLPPKCLTLPLGRFVAQLRRQEFLNLVRHRRVALVGKRQQLLLKAGAGDRTALLRPGILSNSQLARTREETESPSRSASQLPPELLSPSEEPKGFSGQNDHGAPADWLDFD